MLNQSSRRALPQVIQFCGVERQKLGQRQLLAAIEHVALVLGDDQRQARDLGRRSPASRCRENWSAEFRTGDPASPRRLLISASIARISL